MLQQLLASPSPVQHVSHFATVLRLPCSLRSGPEFMRTASILLSDEEASQIPILSLLLHTAWRRPAIPGRDRRCSRSIQLWKYALRSIDYLNSETINAPLVRIQEHHERHILICFTRKPLMSRLAASTYKPSDPQFNYSNTAVTLGVW